MEYGLEAWILKWTVFAPAVKKKDFYALWLIQVPPPQVLNNWYYFIYPSSQIWKETRFDKDKTGQDWTKVNKT